MSQKRTEKGKIRYLPYQRSSQPYQASGLISEGDIAWGWYQIQQCRIRRKLGFLWSLLIDLYRLLCFVLHSVLNCMRAQMNGAAIQ